MIRSILYATDLGLYASYVLQHALAMSRSFKADLYVVHAVEPMGLFAESVLQSYLDEQALNEFHSQGLNTVIASIEQPFEIDSHSIFIGASIGVAMKRFGHQSMQAIQSQADEAMYVAKREGRNRVAYLRVPVSPGPGPTEH